MDHLRRSPEEIAAELERWDGIERRHAERRIAVERRALASTALPAKSLKSNLSTRGESVSYSFVLGEDLKTAVLMLLENGSTLEDCKDLCEEAQREYDRTKAGK